MNRWCAEHCSALRADTLKLGDFSISRTSLISLPSPMKKFAARNFIVSPNALFFGFGGNSSAAAQAISFPSSAIVHGQPAGLFQHAAGKLYQPAERFYQIVEPFHQPAKPFYQTAERFYQPAESFHGPVELFCQAVEPFYQTFSDPKQTVKHL